ncbi:MAG TPA: UbiA family prenyltransferase [Candidatus Bathyarchaeia archaeon]|nr:UbiA family prenyltransferase [Candidatus Bathyarchaeia archaeon]
MPDQTRISRPAGLEAFLAIIRIPNCIMIGLAVLIGEIIGLGTLPSLGRAILGFATAFLLLAGTMVLNDIYDVEIDRVNSPDRPLPSGKIKVSQAYAIVIVLSLLGVLSAALLGTVAFLVALLALGLMIYYNARGKKAGLVGNAVVSFNIALPFVFGGLAVNNLRPLLFVFSILAYFANMAREIAKGISDVRGDRAEGVKTLAVLKGTRFAAWMSSGFFVAAVIASFLTPLWDRVSILYYPGVLVADLGFLYSSYRLLTDQGPETVKAVKTQVLVWMLFGLVGFLMGGTLFL